MHSLVDLVAVDGEDVGLLEKTELPIQAVELVDQQETELAQTEPTVVLES
jgi:hypothetical protein